MTDFRYGFFCRPENKKIESHPEEKSKTSHDVSDHKCKPARVDAEGRRQPIAILPGTRYVTTTETYTEEVYSSSRDGSQHSHTKKYEPVKYYGLRPDKGYRHPIDKLVAKVEASQPKHDTSLSEPMNDIQKALEYFKEAVNLHSAKNPWPASDDPKKDSNTKTIDSKEAARRYGNVGRPAPVQGGSNVPTIDCKEAARKYKGTTV